MVIRRKDPDAERRKFISEGGKSADTSKEWTNVLFRIPRSMLAEIDSVVESRVGMSRTAWILQVLQEKLEKN